MIISNERFFIIPLLIINNVFNLKTICHIHRMKILVKKTIHYYISKYPQAEKGLLLWVNEFSKYNFTNFNEIKNIYGNASIINNNRVIFNIKGNDFKLIVSTNFIQQTC